MKKIGISIIIFLIGIVGAVSAKEVQIYFYTNGATSSSSNVNIADKIVTLKSTGDYYTTYKDTDTIKIINSINNQKFTLTKQGTKLVSGKEWYAFDKNYKMYYFSESKQYKVQDILKVLGKEKDSKPMINMYANWQGEITKNSKTITVTFHKNDGTDQKVTQSFTTKVKGNRFGYNTDGKPRWQQTGQFGLWNRTGYKLLGWSKTKSSKTEQYSIYSGVKDTWIESYQPKINLYAIWEKTSSTSTPSTNAEKKVAVTNISLNKTKTILNIGEAETLSLTISPKSITNENVTWTSTNDKIVSVDKNGKITAKSNGIATITAKVGSKTSKCVVTSIVKEDVYVYFYNPGFVSDAIVVKSGNKVMIIDGGFISQNGKDNDFIDYIKNTLKITKVDIYVGSHGHEDHISIAGKIIKEFNIKKIYVPVGDMPSKVSYLIKNPEKIVTKADGSTVCSFQDKNGNNKELSIEKSTKGYVVTKTKKGYTFNGVNYRNYTIAAMLKHANNEERKAITSAKITYLKASNSFKLGNSTFTVLNPLYDDWSIHDLTSYASCRKYNEGSRSYSSLNQNSLVLRMDRGTNSFLFTADTSKESKYAEINEKYSGKLDVDVYKNGHHHNSIKATNGELHSKYLYIKPMYIVMTPGTITDVSSITGIHQLDNNIKAAFSVWCGNVVMKSDGKEITVISGEEYKTSCHS